MQGIGTAGRSFGRSPWLKRGCDDDDDDDDVEELQILNHNFLYVRSTDLHKDLKTEMVTVEIRRFVRKH